MERRIRTENTEELGLKGNERVRGCAPTFTHTLSSGERPCPNCDTHINKDFRIPWELFNEKYKTKVYLF